MTLSEIVAVRKFFSEKEWDIIYDALFEYKNQDEDDVNEVMNKISSIWKVYE